MNTERRKVPFYSIGFFLVTVGIETKGNLSTLKSVSQVSWQLSQAWFLGKPWITSDLSYKPFKSGSAQLRPKAVNYLPISPRLPPCSFLAEKDAAVITNQVQLLQKVFRISTYRKCFQKPNLKEQTLHCITYQLYHKLFENWRYVVFIFASLGLRSIDEIAVTHTVSMLRAAWLWYMQVPPICPSLSIPPPH